MSQRPLRRTLRGSTERMISSFSEVGYPLKPGDTLFFDADAPHGPEVLVKLPARFLSIISYVQGK